MEDRKALRDTRSSPNKRRRPIALVFVFGCLIVGISVSSCTLVSGWSDLQGGNKNGAGTPPRTDSGTSSSTDATTERDVGVDANAGIEPSTLPECLEDSSNTTSCQCSKGSCSIGCTSSACVLIVRSGADAIGTCTFGGCRFRCEGGATCDTSCTGGGCTFECLAGATCNNQCTGGNCIFRCEPGSVCNNTCVGGGCT